MKIAERKKNRLQKQRSFNLEQKYFRKKTHTGNGWIKKMHFDSFVD